MYDIVQSMINASKTTDRIYQFIQSYAQEKGKSPTYREIMNGVNLKSVSTVEYHLYKLERQGKIVCESACRSIRVIGEK